MDRIEFENKLLVRGGDLERWPVAEAEAARRLLAVDAESRALLAEILTSDETVRTQTTAPLDTALIGRVMAATRRPPARRGLLSGWRPMIPTGALAILLVAIVGFKSGYDDGFGIAQDLDLAGVIAGDLQGLEDTP
ncbi:hypothetical protein [Pleomorphomonas oryzae]|uniref:hypothetical protein n=1 Tax=Pleomorphomonas oryzae TaxID=261934 RepID=UPI00047C82DB|nr:hypothetical protein [Pleomorphomonas oryzae]